MCSWSKSINDIYLSGIYKMEKVYLIGIVKICVWYTILTFLCTCTRCSLNEGTRIVPKSPRSIKNAFHKETSPYGAKVIADMQNEISSLDRSVQNISSSISAIKVRNKGLEESINEQQVILENVEKKIDSIENLLATHGTVLDDLKQIVQPDEQAFAVSNNTCGNFLHAQSGYVTYFTITRKLSPCTWIIQANYRSVIKLTAHAFDLYGIANTAGAIAGAYVMEIMTGPFQIKSTKLMSGITYSFKGPLIYVVLMSQDESAYNSLSFGFHYEGQGVPVGMNTLFSHKIWNNNLSRQMEQFSNEDLQELTESSNSYSTNQSLLFSSIIISNFTTKLRLLTTLENEGCSNSFFGVFSISNLLGGSTNGSILTNLCNSARREETRNLLTSYGKPIFVFIAKPLDHSLPFNLSWSIGNEYSSSSYTYSYHSVLNRTTCGGVLGGSSGTISYKLSSKLKNGERCVWVIAPTHETREHIKLTIEYGTQTNEISTYDYLYLMELTTPDGNERADGPKIVRVQSSYSTYTVRSREVYVVLYTDSSVQSSGFLIKWNSTGDRIQPRNDISAQFNLFSNETGTMTIIPLISELYSTLYQVFLFTPVLPSSSSSSALLIPNYVFGMHLELNHTTAKTGENGTSCVQQSFTILASSADNPILQNANNTQCHNPGMMSIRNADGMVIVISKTTRANNRENNVALNFSWKQEVTQDDRSVVKMTNNRCGGVLTGKRGILRYKVGALTDEMLNKDEHCLWLVQSPNSASVTVKILKDAVDSRLHPLVVVNTIDVQTGTLKNDSVLMSSRSPYFQKLQVFNESLLVISMRPSGNSRTGFILQFWGNDGANDDDKLIEYRLRHSDAKSGRFQYDWSSQHYHGPGKQLHVVAYSITNVAHVTTTPILTSVNWIRGIFMKSNESCTYDSISFYTTMPLSSEYQSYHSSWPSSRNTSQATHTWKLHATFPQEHATLLCPNQITKTSLPNILTTNNFAFLVIYKLVRFPVETMDVERRIDFLHAQNGTTTRSPSSFWSVESDDDSVSAENPFFSSYTERERLRESVLIASLLRRYNLTSFVPLS